MRIERYKQGRFFALYDAAGKLVVITVYKRGAVEVKRRLYSQPKEEAAELSAASASFVPQISGRKNDTY